jgi:uncharacterized protein YndB with AHSA1/START domain
MARNTIRIHATPEEVFDVLDDAHAYPRWVVGTRRVRGVDPNWPAVGSRFHHAIGTFVAELHDSSMVLDRRRPERMELEVRFRPTGVAWVRITVESDGQGSVVVFEERPRSGPFQKIPRCVTDPVLTARNALSLRRLRRVVERRAASSRSEVGTPH